MMNSNNDKVFNSFIKKSGFTEERHIMYILNNKYFSGYLAEEDKNTIIISSIISKQKNKGNFSKLIKCLKEKYNKIIIPTPFDEMIIIANHLGFVLKTIMYPPPFNEKGRIMIWNKK